MDNQLFSIGAIIIAKDNEETVARAISSVSPVCSQIVVVDTGSKDRTPSICSRFGAEVHFFRWIDDFAAVRNYAMFFVRTDWVVCIDTDEELDSDSLLDNLALMQNSETGGVRVKIVNYLGDDNSSVQSEHYYTRIFRRNTKFTFEGKIHEQIAPSILDAGFNIVPSEITIHHYGYKNINDEKITRNREMLTSETAKSPKDSWLKYHLAETEFTAKNYAEAKRLFGEVYEENELVAGVLEICRCRLAQIALNDNVFDDVEKWCDFASEDINREGFRKYILATVKILKGDYNSAKFLTNSVEIFNSSLVDRISLNRMTSVLEKLLEG